MENKNKNNYWRKMSVFNDLCEIVMQNRLVCLTGAGISKGLKLENGNSAPDWKELLLSINEKIDDKLDNEQKEDVRLLLENEPKGEELIEASTILRNADEDKFRKYLVESVKLEKGVFTETHMDLLNLDPNGIITYNYDEAHENSMDKSSVKSNWTILMPHNEEKIKEIIINRFQHKFLLKAHGTVGDEESMVLTRDSYRDLFVKHPSYKAFLQNIFTNYQLLIIGFGFSDPDFDLLIKDIFSSYGSPIQKHIVIKHIREKSSMDTLYKLRYGMNYLYVEKFIDISLILKECAKDGGEYIENIIKQCLSEKLEERSKVHKEIRNLSIIGKKCLAGKLMTKIEKIVEEEKEPSYDRSTELSELVYSFGILLDVDETYKQFLITNVIEKSIDSEPVAHALTLIASYLTLDDMDKIDKWINRFESNPFRKDPHNPDPHNRNLVYCEYLKVYVEAKYVEHD